MTSMQRWLAPLALALALAACSGDRPADSAAAPAAAAPEAPAATPADAATAAAEELANISGEIALDKARLDRYFAAMSNLNALVKQDPALEDVEMGDSETTDQFVARIEAEPRVRAALAQAGMSAREYTLTSEALVASMYVVTMLETGTIKELPPEANKANVEFVKAHMAEIESRMQALGAG